MPRSVSAVPTSFPVAVILFGISVGLSPASESVESARSAVKEWVRTENAISREAAEWEGDKALLRDLIEVAEQRVQRLEEEIEKNRSTLSTADRKRADLLEREAEAEDRAERIRTFLARHEDALRAIRARLPEPLNDELESSFRRLPDGDGSRSPGLGERMQTVLNLMHEIRDFDSRVTVSESVRGRPESDTKAVYRTLYLGLGHAWYLGPEDAGFGIPGNRSWEWTSHPGAEEAIRRAIAVADGRSSELHLFDLPIRIPVPARPSSGDADSGESAMNQNP